MQRELAIALGYESEIEAAPRVLAAGEGRLARRLREIAEQHRVPLRQDADLAEILVQVPLQEEIPPEIYPAVAEIFAFLYLVARDRREG